MSDLDAASMDLQAAGAGQLRKHEQFRSRLFRYSRDLIVYLPAGYDELPSRRFPVLYMQDGQNLFDPATSFVPGMHWRMGETADELIAAGAIQPLIIVGIYNAGDRRVREYTPTRAWRLGGGRADRYGRMLIEEIKPFIESEYRTLAGAAHTGLGGSSLGGLVTLYLGLSHPHVFGRLAALSPSVWWGSRWIHGFAGRAPGHPRPRIWLDIGAREGGAREGPRIVQDVTRFRDILAERGWTPGHDLHFEEVEGAEHNEAAWAHRVGPFLQFLFPAAESAV